MRAILILLLFAASLSAAPVADVEFGPRDQVRNMDVQAIRAEALTRDCTPVRTFVAKTGLPAPERQTEIFGRRQNQGLNLEKEAVAPPLVQPPVQEVVKVVEVSPPAKNTTPVVIATLIASFVGAAVSAVVGIAVEWRKTHPRL